MQENITKRFYVVALSRKERCSEKCLTVTQLKHKKNVTQ